MTMQLDASRILSGDTLAISRFLTQIENREEGAGTVLDELYPHTGKAHIIGITGPSGSGKSTLVNRLGSKLAKGSDKHLGIIAVDPTSPFSGGAILGDRIRMRDLSSQQNIFIRSMATRGALGGLARAADEAVQVLDAAGFYPVLVETVGAGQAEVDIARLAHTVVVVEAPGMGDDIQSVKAGILEIADILVLNKNDHPAAEAAAHSLATMLDIGTELRASPKRNETSWQVPLIRTNAVSGEGLEELADAIRAHQDYLQASGEWEVRSRKRVRENFERLVREKVFIEWQKQVNREAYQQALDDVSRRELSPRGAINTLLNL